MIKPLVTLLILASLVPAALAQKPKSTAPAGVYQLPEAKRIKLPNGMVVILLEKHELPLISATLALRSGSVTDPAGKEGLAATTADLLRKGTTTESADQLSDAIDFIGMTYGAGASLEDTTVSVDYLKKDNARALGLLADMVLHPVFPADEVTKLVARQQDQLRSAKDDPQRVIGLYFMAALYGSNPYARPINGTDQTLGRITRDDVTSFYAKNYTPANAVLAIAGDFDTAAMEAQLKTLFDGWKGAAPAPVAVPALKPVAGKHVLLIDKPDATQTYFIIGNVGIGERSPDRAEVRVVNTLFGGRFSSMFNDELRIKSGYSYGANSTFQTLQQPGPFEMVTYTRNATTEPAIDKSFEVLARLHTHPLTDADLTSAKNYLRGTFPPTLETTPALARTYAELEVSGQTRAEFNARLAGEQATSVAEANHVIDTDFPTDNYVMVIVGKASEIGTIAAKYGTVTTKKISDPGF